MCACVDATTTNSSLNTFICFHILMKVSRCSSNRLAFSMIRFYGCLRKGDRFIPHIGRIQYDRENYRLPRKLSEWYVWAKEANCMKRFSFSDVDYLLGWARVTSILEELLWSTITRFKGKRLNRNNYQKIDTFAKIQILQQHKTGVLKATKSSPPFLYRLCFRSISSTGRRGGAWQSDSLEEKGLSSQVV